MLGTEEVLALFRTNGPCDQLLRRDASDNSFVVEFTGFKAGIQKHVNCLVKAMYVRALSQVRKRAPRGEPELIEDLAMELLAAYLDAAREFELPEKNPLRQFNYTLTMKVSPNALRDWQTRVIGSKPRKVDNGSQLTPFPRFYGSLTRNRGLIMFQKLTARLHMLRRGLEEIVSGSEAAVKLEAEVVQLQAEADKAYAQIPNDGFLSSGVRRAPVGEFEEAPGPAFAECVEGAGDESSEEPSGDAPGAKVVTGSDEQGGAPHDDSRDGAESFEGESVLDLAPSPTDSPSPDRERLVKAMEALKDLDLLTWQVAYSLGVLEGTVRGVSRELGIPEEEVRRRMDSAMEFLRGQLKGRMG